MIVKRKTKKGVALVTSLVFTTTVLGILTVVLYKITETTKDIVYVQKVNTAKNIADEGLEHIVDWMNNRNLPTNYSTNGSDTIMSMTKENFLEPINGTSVNNTSLNYQLSSLDIDPVMALSGEKNIYKRTTNSITTFLPPIVSTEVIVEGNSNGVLSQIDTNSKIYTFNSRDKNNKIKGQFIFGISPISSESKFDFMRIGVNSYVPSINDPKAIIKKYVAVVQRPKNINVGLNHAILSGDSINLGNGDSAGGYSVTNLVTNEGDVHTNHDLVIGPQGTINGDASATGTITNTGTVTGAVTPNSPEKPIPKLDYDDPFPSNPCIPIGLPNNRIINGPCTVSGDLSLSGSAKLTITGKVYIQGNYSETGNSSIIGQSTSSSPMSMLIVSGNLKTAGNGSTSTDNKMAFVSTGGNMEVKGNGNVNGLFFNDNPNGEVSVTGNGSIFGGIVAQGTVSFSGNNASVTRDLSIVNLPVKVDPASYSMRLVSWRELN